MSDCGYLITWAPNKHGTWFNAWGPASTNPKAQIGRRAHIDASYDKDKIKAACEEHAQRHSRGAIAA
jgi:hypothetical protein